MEYTPSGAIVEKFHLDPSFVRIIMGPLGSGKTTGCCYEVLRRAMQQKPNSRGVRATRWLVCRNTIPELETTTLPSWRQHFNTELGSWKMTSPITHSWKFPVGDGTHVHADIFFLGLDGPDAANKIRGMEITGAWLNEAKDIPRSVFDMITGRVGRYPPKKDGGPTWYGIIGDTNMPDDDHWMYVMAEQTHPEGWMFFRQPGGVYKIGDQWVLSANAENIAHLPENYYKNQLAGKSEEWIRVFLAAEYGYVADGRPVYPEYSDVHHVADLTPIKGEPIYVGADFGLTPAAVFLQKDVWGRWLVMHELVTFDVGAAQFGRTIKRTLAERFPGCQLAGAWGDPIGAKRSATDEDIRTMFQILASVGVPFRAAPGNNELVLRRESVASPLTRLVDGKPGLIIDRKCLKLRAGMSGKYCFKRVAVRGDVFADKPDKNEYSHVAEALQYVMLGVGEGRELVENKNHRIQKPSVITGTMHNHRVARKRTSQRTYR
jgi:hypothetical protein